VAERITVLCEECEKEKRELERGGRRKVISCKPKPEDPRFCWLEFEFNFAAGGGAAQADPAKPDGTS
jgi:hypothetical protein